MGEKLTKLQGWESNLHSFLSESKNKKFGWGDWDCALFADGAIQKMAGESALDGLEWHDKRSAIKAIRENGTFLDAVINRLEKAGLERIENKHCEKGDIVIYKAYFRHIQGLENNALGVYEGYNIAGPSEVGMVRTKPTNLVRVYRLNESR